MQLPGENNAGLSSAGSRDDPHQPTHGQNNSPSELEFTDIDNIIPQKNGFVKGTGEKNVNFSFGEKKGREFVAWLSDDEIKLDTDLENAESPQR